MLALQRSAGNRAVASRLQRKLTVSTIDWDPQSRKHTPSDLPMQPVLDVFGPNFEKRLETRDEVKRFQQLKNKHFDGADIPDLVNKVIGFVWQHAGRKADMRSTYGQRLEDALGKVAKSDASQKERGVFQRVLEKCDPKSRSKGAPSVVALTSLDPGMQNGISGKQQMLQGHLASLTTAASYFPPGVNPRVLFSSDLALIRSAHTNNAGWLAPTTRPPTTALDRAAKQWARGIINAPANDPAGHAALVAAFTPALNNVDALAIENLDTLPAATRQSYYTTVHVATLPAAELVRHAAFRYADSTFAGANFIEISADSCGGLSRIVWDVMRDQYYVGAHYHWVEGFNPFIHVTGLGATY